MTTYQKPRDPTPTERRVPPPGAASAALRPSSIPRLTGDAVAPGRMPIPWTTLADGASLLLALALVFAFVGWETSNARLVMAALTASSLFVWLLLLQFRSLATILRRQRGNAYPMPLLAVASTAAVLGAGGVVLPWLAFAGYVVVWTGGLVVSRWWIARGQAPLRILLIGSPAFQSELEMRRGIEVECRSEPPERVNGWDVVATDPAESYDREWLQWISHADMHDVKVISAPLLLETITARVPTEMLHGRWAFEVLAGRSRYQFWKRLFDVVAVVVAAPLLLPLLGIVALVVAIDGGRPVLFWQDRVGLGGRPFRMVKFRTMAVDAERNGSVFATAADPRVTRVGRILRHYRLDELPQFWNVLRGEMSIIGPRPEQLAFAELFGRDIPLYQLRHNVRPGITGWAQVRHGYAAGTTETQKKLRYDFYYVKYCSFGLDVLIVWRTILTILTGFGSR